jgi:retinol dehydrogenase 14
MTDPALSGKTVVVTGGTAGIGEATARRLAGLGARVGVVGRDPERGRAVANSLTNDVNTRGAELFLADLSDLGDVRRLASEIQARFDRVDVLFNNAGVDVGKRVTTADGLELTFVVNYLAPFLLTNLLLDRLRASAPSRILNAASGAYRGGSVDFDDLQSERRFGQRAYNTSKLELILFTYELARRLEGSRVTANCVDPGFVKTQLGATMPLGYRLVGALLWPFMVSPDKGADTAVWAASDPELEAVTGAYLKGRRRIDTEAKTRERATAARLWEVSASLTGISTG